MPHKDLEEVRERWNKTPFTESIHANPVVVDVEHDRIADWWLAEMNAREEKLREKIEYAIASELRRFNLNNQMNYNTKQAYKSGVSLAKRAILALLTPNNL